MVRYILKVISTTLLYYREPLFTTHLLELTMTTTWLLLVLLLLCTKYMINFCESLCFFLMKTFIFQKNKGCFLDGGWGRGEKCKKRMYKCIKGTYNI